MKISFLNKEKTTAELPFLILRSVNECSKVLLWKNKPWYIIILTELIL